MVCEMGGAPAPAARGEEREPARKPARKPTALKRLREGRFVEGAEVW
jgi:hypothetical protein